MPKPYKWLPLEGHRESVRACERRLHFLRPERNVE
jgi:hypothetical protein